MRSCPILRMPDKSTGDLAGEKTRPSTKPPKIGGKASGNDPAGALHSQLANSSENDE